MGTSVDDVISGAEKAFGARSVMRLTDKKKLKIPAQRTGVPQLDLALGVGGLPKGRIVEIYGPESSGKTTLAAKIIATAQKDGAWVWYGDMEHALDPEWFEKIGVNMDKLLISQPDHGNQCLDMAQYMIKTGVIDIIVVDSVSALVPEAELNGESGDAVMGLQARMMSQSMRKLSPVVSRMQAIGIFINQIREKIGVQWGSPETTSGGRALKFFASVRIDIRRTGSVGEKGNEVGNAVKMKVVKNKVAPPFKICEADLMFDGGFNLGQNLLYAGLTKGVFEKSGAWYSWEGNRMGCGAVAAGKFIMSLGEEKINELYTKIVGKQIKEDKPEPSDDYKARMEKYAKKLAEAETDEEKEKWQRKIDKLKANGEIEEEDVETNTNEIGSAVVEGSN